MANPKDEDIKVRVSLTMKEAVRGLAEARDTTESEIAREALREYLIRRHVIPGQIHEDPPGTLPPYPAPVQPVTYSAALEKQAQRIADKLKPGLKRALKRRGPAAAPTTPDAPHKQ